MTAPNPVRFVAVMLSVGALAAVSAVELAAKTPRPERQTSRPSEDRREWTLETGKDGGFQMKLERRWRDGASRSTSSWSFDAHPDEFQGLPPNLDKLHTASVHFQMRRDPGVFVFDGTVSRGMGRGTYRFEPNQEFRDAVRHAGMEPPTDDDLERLCSHDVRLETVRALVKHGYAGLSTDDLVRLAIHGASPAFVREMANLEPRPSINDLVRLHIHGVTPEFAQAMASLGFPSADDLVRFRLHDVTLEFTRKAMTEHPHLSADDLVRLRLNGRL